LKVTCLKVGVTSFQAVRLYKRLMRS